MVVAASFCNLKRTAGARIMTRILVTGGAGYVGSHVCKRLAAHGHEPIVLDNLSRGHRDAVKWGPLEVGDISDSRFLDRVFSRYRVDCVMHFAAVCYVTESVSVPDLYYGNNVSGTLTLLDAMRRHDVGHLVFSSSCAIYGIPDQVPIPESQEQRPISPYGFGKSTVERILSDYGAAYDLRFACLRYFNAAGADPEGEIGECHSPETHAIPLALMAAMGKIPWFDVLGTDYQTADGSAIRDYAHVWDLADAHVKALDLLLGGGESFAVNLGTGTGTSVLELLSTVERITGRTIPFRLKPRRPGDPPVLVAAAGKAREILGWTPRLSSIQDLVGTAHAWLNGEGFRGSRSE